MSAKRCLRNPHCTHSRRLNGFPTITIMSESEDDLKPFEYELPQTPLNVINSWVVRLQAVAIVTALLAQIEVSLIGMLEDVGNSPPASDTAVRIFGYSGLILNLGATLSAVLLLLAVTSVPTAARRLYMTCRHGYPRKVFLHTKNNSVIEVEPKTDTTTPSASNLQFPRSLPPQVVPDTLADMQSLNRFLLRGDTEGNILYAFGVARGWGFLLRHCIFCFIGGCVCTFVHVCIALWVSESTTVASLLMPVAVVGFIPPLAVFFFGMDSPSCKQCREDRKSSHLRLDDVYVSRCSRPSIPAFNVFSCTANELYCISDSSWTLTQSHSFSQTSVGSVVGMLRRESWTVIFQRKKSPSYDYQFPSLEEIEKQFEDAERDRSNVFESSQRQLEFDFLEAEAARRLPEEQREQEFDQFLCRVRDKFLSDEKLRLVEFEEAEAKQERVFQSNEVRRGGVFEQKQGVREWDFNKSHEERDKQAKWFLQLIEQLFSKGHAYREEIYNRMVDSLSAEFLNMLRSAQETFIFAQTKRNDIIKKMVRSSKSRMNTLESNSPFSNAGRALVSPSDKTERSPKPIMIPSPSRSPSTLYRPSTIGSDGPWIPAAPPTVIQTSARPASPSSSALRPIRVASRPKVVKNETDDSRGASSSGSRRRALRDLLAFYSALLHEKEEKRAVLFRSALNSHDSSFKRAEAQRALTTGRRDSRFNEAEFSLESQFNSSQGAFRDQFDSREQVRNGAEDHRDQLFEDAQSRFELIFGQQQSSHSRRVAAVCATEKRFAASCKSRVKNLLLGMEQIVRDTREKHRMLFTETCSGYQEEPAAQHTTPELVSAPQMITIGHPQESHHSHQDYIRVTTSHSPSPDNLRAPGIHPMPPASQLSDRAPDPETMFAPKTLFKASGWSAGLPLPQTEDIQKQHIYSSSTIEEHLKMHQAFFNKKEARRHKEAEHALHRWQQIFTINELKRQDEFKTQQKRCHDTVVQRQVTQHSQFWTEQQEREEEFQKNESERERLFWTQEEERFSDFKSSQESRDTQFHKQQESLLTKAQLQETQRKDDFSGWEISMQGKFWGMVMKWRNGFANDELKMERTFKKIAQSADA